MESPQAIQFDGCADIGHDCRSGYFRVEFSDGSERQIEIQITAQEEHVLAGHVGQPTFSEEQRVALLKVAGIDLINHCITDHGYLPRKIFLTSRHLFGRPGAQRDLLRRAGLL